MVVHLLYVFNQTFIWLLYLTMAHYTLPIGFLAHIPWAVSAVGLQVLGQNWRWLILLSFVLVYDCALNQYYNLLIQIAKRPHSAFCLWPILNEHQNYFAPKKAVMGY